MKISNSRGFSLLETMIALAVLSILAMASAGLMTNILRAQVTATVDSDILGLVSQMRAALQNSTTAVCSEDLSSGLQVVNPLNTVQVIASGGMSFNNKLWNISMIGLTNTTVLNGVTKGTVVMTVNKDTTRLYGAPQSQIVVTDIYCTTPVAPVTPVDPCDKN